MLLAADYKRAHVDAVHRRSSRARETGSIQKRTGQGANVRERLGVGARLEDDGAAFVAAIESEGEGLSLLGVDLGVGEGGLGEDASGQDGSDGCSGELHFDELVGYGLLFG